MKNKYKHLTSEERDLISVLHSKGLSAGRIASKLKRDKTTVTRELKRNCSAKYGVYLSNRAHQRAVNRKHKAGIRPRLKNSNLRALVVRHLKRGRTPEQISGSLCLKHGENIISPEAIYQFIYAKETRRKLNLVP